MLLSTERLFSPRCEHASIPSLPRIACLREGSIGLAGSFMESSQTEVGMACHTRCQTYISSSSINVFRPSFFHHCGHFLAGILFSKDNLLDDFP